MDRQKNSSRAAASATGKSVEMDLEMLSYDALMLARIVNNLIETEVKHDPSRPGWTFTLNNEQADMLGFASGNAMAAAYRIWEKTQ